jgi:long-chain acyl-CoA synthetase
LVWFAGFSREAEEAAGTGGEQRMRKQVNLENIGILDLLYILTKKYNGKAALQAKDGDILRKISYDGLREKSVGVSTFLIEKDIAKGTHIAILSENRPEWAITFFGIISAACVTIPIDAKLSIKEILFILNDSGAECIFVSGKFLDLICSQRNQIPKLRYLVCFDSHDKQDVFYLEDLKWKEGEDRNRPQDVKPQDTVIIVYTSGTTGVAKGVELSYKNLLFEVMALYELIKFDMDDSFISILPLNHMLEITGGLIAPLYGGATITYCDTLKPHYIISLMREVKATGMMCVPLILKMFYNGILKEAEKLPAYKQRIFKFFLGFSHFLLRFNIRIGKIFFHGVHKKFGKRFKSFVCGGAPLDTQLEKDFDALGFVILQGYGLTETSPVLCVNTYKDRRYGSVGKPLRGVKVKILKHSENDKEGEIIAKGPNIMKGYYNSPQKTDEVLKDSWFYTGDLGYLDKDGFLYISGRAKNLIVLGGGKKIFPEEAEQVMNECPHIKEICVLGKKATGGLKAGTEEVFAVVVPNLDAFDENERKNHDFIKEKINSEINRLSENLAEYKKISDFQLYFDELPKTSTRKIKRNLVSELIDKR